jgi:hypothetical protein
MKKKLTLNVDALAVASFATDAEAAQGAGTVHGRAIVPTPPQYACTCQATCDCPSAYYWCGDGYYTLYSCDYTKNESCVVTRACTA